MNTHQSMTPTPDPPYTVKWRIALRVRKTLWWIALSLLSFVNMFYMGRVAAGGDNAVMESFFSLLQRNVLKAKTWGRREELTIAVITWIERRYHQRRRQKRLGRLTPIKYETINTNTAIKAA